MLFAYIRPITWRAYTKHTHTHTFRHIRNLRQLVWRIAWPGLGGKEQPQWVYLKSVFSPIHHCAPANGHSLSRDRNATRSKDRGVLIVSGLARGAYLLCTRSVVGCARKFTPWHNRTCSDVRTHLATITAVTLTPRSTVSLSSRKRLHKKYRHRATSSRVHVNRQTEKHLDHWNISYIITFLWRIW